MLIGGSPNLTLCLVHRVLVKDRVLKCMKRRGGALGDKLAVVALPSPGPLNASQQPVTILGDFYVKGNPFSVRPSRGGKTGEGMGDGYIEVVVNLRSSNRFDKDVIFVFCTSGCVIQAPRLTRQR